MSMLLVGQPLLCCFLSCQICAQVSAGRRSFSADAQRAAIISSPGLSEIVKDAVVRRVRLVCRVRYTATRAGRVEGRGRVDGVEVDGTPPS